MPNHRRNYSQTRSTAVSTVRSWEKFSLILSKKLTIYIALKNWTQARTTRPVMVWLNALTPRYAKHSPCLSVNIKRIGMFLFRPLYSPFTLRRTKQQETLFCLAFSTVRYGSENVMRLQRLSFEGTIFSPVLWHRGKNTHQASPVWSFPGRPV